MLADTFWRGHKAHARLSCQVMGHGLKGLPRDQYVLATKVGRYDKAKFDFSAERVTASVHESLKRLQVDHIDLIQTHDIEFGDLDQVNTCSDQPGPCDMSIVPSVVCTSYACTVCIAMASVSCS